MEWGVFGNSILLCLFIVGGFHRRRVVLSIIMACLEYHGVSCVFLRRTKYRCRRTNCVFKDNQSLSLSTVSFSGCLPFYINSTKRHAMNKYPAHLTTAPSRSTHPPSPPYSFIRPSSISSVHICPRVILILCRLAHCGCGKRRVRLRRASAHVSWVETRVSYGVELAHPSQKALEAETVAAVGRGAVSGLWKRG
jgi:hypothetical protein